MKKKIIFGTSVLVASLAIGVAAFTAQNRFVRFGKSTDNAEWHHYSAVPATLDSRGIKEYWVSCESHDHQFTAPSSTNIVDMGTPSQAFINALADDDDRLIEQYKRIYDFSDGVLPSFITANTNVSSIIVGNSLSASNKTVEVTISSNDYGVNIGKEYMDAAFADPNVEAVAFDAHASEATSNFRYRHNGSNTCYEKNEAQSTETGYGLVTGGFKSFYYTRSMYNNWTTGTYKNGNGECAIWGGGSVAPKTLYIDNIRVVSHVSNSRGYIDFETGAFNTGSRDYRNMSGTAIFAGGDSSYTSTFNYANKTTGTRSMSVNKSASTAIAYTVNVNGDFYKNIPSEGFLFDVRSTSKYNHSVAIRNGNDTKVWQYVPGTTTSTPSLEANLWYTYHITPSDINSSGRFFIVNASTTGEFYMDNLRYATGTAFGFEGACVQQNGEYVTVAGGEFSADQSGTLRDTTCCYNLIINNGSGMATAYGLDSEHVTEGAQALKVTYGKTGYNRFFFEPYLLDSLDSTDTISIDVYSDGVTFQSGTLFADVTPGQWTTITLTKSQFVTKSAFGRLNSKTYTIESNITHAGNVWFDNIRATNVE